jgi:Putative restriction endonuclease
MGLCYTAGMGEDRPGYSLKAPGASGRSLHLPGRGPFPPVDEHLVEPEVTRDEIIGGRRVVAFPAEAPHADQHDRLQYVLHAHVAPGYVASVDLLTRFDQNSDFASDACVRREGVDPQTGRRHLEELAFEVVSEQREKKVSEKVPRMHRRGVRRIFAIFIKNRQVCEWSADGLGSWRPLVATSEIEDPCLAKPLGVAALLDAAAADDAVIQALAAKDNPELRRMKAAAEAQGIAKSILRVLETRGVAVSPDQRQEILGCADLDRLNRWLDQAILATAADEILQG